MTRIFSVLLVFALSLPSSARVNPKATLLPSLACRWLLADGDKLPAAKLCSAVILRIRDQVIQRIRKSKSRELRIVIDLKEGQRPDR
jgi:hypothetical protein